MIINMQAFCDKYFRDLSIYSHIPFSIFNVPTLLCFYQLSLLYLSIALLCVFKLFGFIFTNAMKLCICCKTGTCTWCYTYLVLYLQSTVRCLQYLAVSKKQIKTLHIGRKEASDEFMNKYVCVIKTFASLHSLQVQGVIRNIEEDYP